MGFNFNEFTTPYLLLGKLFIISKWKEHAIFGGLIISIKLSRVCMAESPIKK